MSVSYTYIEISPTASRFAGICFGSTKDHQWRWQAVADHIRSFVHFIRRLAINLCISDDLKYTVYFLLCRTRRCCMSLRVLASPNTSFRVHLRSLMCTFCYFPSSVNSSRFYTELSTICLRYNTLPGSRRYLLRQQVYACLNNPSVYPSGTFANQRLVVVVVYKWTMLAVTNVRLYCRDSANLANASICANWNFKFSMALDSFAGAASNLLIEKPGNLFP